MKPNHAPRPRNIAQTRARRNGRAGLAARLPALLAAACILAPAPGGASPDAVRGDPFTVSDVRVDEQADTAAAARDAAISAAHRIAFARLVARLVPQSQRPRLADPGAVRIAPLVESFAIDSEKASDVRYLAAMTFRFRRADVRRLLRARGVEFAETASRPVLVLPVLDDAGALSLWERPNPWFDAWKALPPSDGLVPVRLPDGGLADIRDIGAGQVAAGDRRRISALAARYGAASALAAVARFRADLRSGRRALEVSLRRFGGSGAEAPRTVRLAREPGEDRNALVARAAREVAAGIEEDWKRRTLLSFAAPGEIVARLAPVRLADWVAVRRALASVAMLRDVQLAAISRRAAAVRLGFYGSVEQLRLALAERGIALDGTPGSWTLAAAPARPAAGRRDADPESSRRQ